MKVKGTVLASVQGYIKENFPNRYQDWLNKLESGSKAIYTQSIMAPEWYPYQEGLIHPSLVLTDMFYNGDIKKSSWEIGRYSAEVGLTGIYKAFVLIATPQFIMKIGGKILASFYQPATLIIGEERKKGVDVHITEFPDITEIAEYRICGWMEKALEICRVKNITINIVESMTKGGENTVFELNWE